MVRWASSSVDAFGLSDRMGCSLQVLSLAHTTRSGWRKCQLSRVDISQDDAQVGIRFVPVEIAMWAASGEVDLNAMPFTRHGDRLGRWVFLYSPYPCDGNGFAPVLHAGETARRLCAAGLRVHATGPVFVDVDTDRVAVGMIGWHHRKRGTASNRWIVGCRVGAGTRGQCEDRKSCRQHQTSKLSKGHRVCSY